MKVTPAGVASVKNAYRGARKPLLRDTLYLLYIHKPLQASETPQQQSLCSYKHIDRINMLILSTKLQIFPFIVNFVANILSDFIFLYINI